MRGRRFASAMHKVVWQASFAILRQGQLPVRVEDHMHNEQLRALYSGLTDEEQEIANETLDRYLEVAWEIYQESLSTDATP
jgi:hypothetical protein